MENNSNKEILDNHSNKTSDSKNSADSEVFTPKTNIYCQ